MTNMGEDVVRKMGDLKRWRSTRNWLIWGFVPGILLLSRVFSYVLNPGWSFLFCVALWFGLIAFVGHRVRNWPCPFCGEPVMQKGWFHNDFSSKCLHCGKSLKPKLGPTSA